MYFQELKRQNGEFGCLMFWCPGCNTHHYIDKRWTVTGTPHAPTVRPSIAVRQPPPKCHLFIENGNLRYLNDCEHKLAGKTVNMEPME